MKKILQYFNPIAHFGNKRYSYIIPFTASITAAVILEIIAYGILRNPEAVGLPAIFVFIALIIFFSYREGIRGGFITALVTLLYYAYIIYSRGYSGAQLWTSVETTIVLGITYFALSGVIGGLKQTIDNLIERESNEKRRLQTILQQLPVGIIITDKDGRIVQANKQADNIFGVKVPEGFKVGERLLVDIKKDGKSLSPAHSPLLLALNGRPTVDKEYFFTRSDKKELYVQMSAAPIHNREGKIIAAAEILNDITDKKELEKRKDDFVNMASHELKTPITSLKLYLDLLTRSIAKYNDPAAEKTIVSIRNQAAKLQKLINDLLDVSRLQTGKLSFTKETFKLDELIQEVVDVLQGSSKHNIVFSNKSSIAVSADKFRVYQVLTNLITNAIKYSPEGKEIKISMSRKDGKAEVRIQDQGIGIAKDQTKKIFERLYQVNNDKEKTFPGFGMGLYISKEIIRRHKGSIGVESEKGKGSTFYFTLPLS